MYALLLRIGISLVHQLELEVFVVAKLNVIELSFFDATFLIMRMNFVLFCWRINKADDPEEVLGVAIEHFRFQYVKGGYFELEAIIL